METITLPDDLIQKLTELAAREHMSVEEFIDMLADRLIEEESNSKGKKPDDLDRLP